MIVHHRAKNPRMCQVCMFEGKRRPATWIVRDPGRAFFYICDEHKERRSVTSD